MRAVEIEALEPEPVQGLERAGRQLFDRRMRLARRHGIAVAQGVRGEEAPRRRERGHQRLELA